LSQRRFITLGTVIYIALNGALPPNQDVIAQANVTAIIGALHTIIKAAVGNTSIVV
jgi:hypothetical protein